MLNPHHNHLHHLQDDNQNPKEDDDEDDGIRMCNFNSLHKLDRNVMDVWANIMRR